MHPPHSAHSPQLFFIFGGKKQKRAPVAQRALWEMDGEFGD
jgi:hypothetical protein